MTTLAMAGHTATLDNMSYEGPDCFIRKSTYQATPTNYQFNFPNARKSVSPTAAPILLTLETSATQSVSTSNPSGTEVNYIAGEKDGIEVKIIFSDWTFGLSLSVQLPANSRMDDITPPYFRPGQSGTAAGRSIQAGAAGASFNISWQSNQPAREISFKFQVPGATSGIQTLHLISVGFTQPLTDEGTLYFHGSRYRIPRTGGLVYVANYSSNRDPGQTVVVIPCKDIERIKSRQGLTPHSVHLDGTATQWWDKGGRPESVRSVTAVIAPGPGVVRVHTAEGAINYTATMLGALGLGSSATLGWGVDGNQADIVIDGPLTIQTLNGGQALINWTEGQY